MKLVTDKANAEREIAFGSLSTDEVMALFNLAVSTSRPLLGLGTLAEVIGGNLYTNERARETKDISQDIERILRVVERPC
jgi:hypothetical protein